MSGALLIAGIVAAVAFGPAAYAAVVITAFSSPLEIYDDFFGIYYPIDVDKSGSTDFTFATSFQGTVLQMPVSSRGVIRLDPPPNVGGPPVPLAIGYLIGVTLEPSEFQDLYWDSNNLTIVQVLSTGSGSAFSGRGAIGIEFQAADGVHYGYFDISAGPGYAGITLFGWAYESQPGVAILVGQVPEPSTLILAGVATAFLLLRYRRE